MKRLKHFSALAILMLAVWGNAQAGKLDDFEDDTTKAGKKDKPAQNDHQNHGDQNRDNQGHDNRNTYRDDHRRDEQRHQEQEEYERHRAWQRERELELERDQSRGRYPSTEGGSVILVPPVYGGDTPPNSQPYNKAQSGSLFDKTAVGGFILPLLRLDYDQGELESSITAKDYQIEAGLGPFAVMHKESTLMEDGSHDELRSRQTFFLYRLGMSKNAEVDFGLGDYTLSGNTKNNESAYSLGLKLHLDNGFGVEYRPMRVNGNDIKLTEHELTIHYGQQYGAVKAGYHWMLSDHESLKGPFLGLTFAF